MKRMLRWLIRVLFAVRLIHFEKLALRGPSLLLPNHISLWDAIFLYLFLPENACFVASREVVKQHPMAFRLVNYVELEPFDIYSLKKLAELVRSGQLVVLFPEARISTTGSLMKLYSGVSFLALKTQASIYPVIFSGLEFSKLSGVKSLMNSRWFPQVSIYLGRPATLPLRHGVSFKRQKEEMDSRVMTIMQEAVFEAHNLRKEVNLFHELQEAALRNGTGKIAAEDPNGTITYSRTIIGSYLLGGKLKALLGKEARVGVLLPTSVGHVVTLFALFYLGKTPAVLNFSAGSKNNIDCAALAGVTTILTSRRFAAKAGLEEHVERLAAVYRIVYLEELRRTISLTDKLKAYLRYKWGCRSEARSGEVIVFTSGSESLPKGVVLSHYNIMTNIHQIGSVIDYTQRDILLNPLPMFHAFGLTVGTLLPLLEGMKVYLYPNPLQYKAIPEIAYQQNVTILLGTPTFLLGYGKNAHNYDFYSMRYVLAGGERLKEEVRLLWEDKFGLRILEGYGTTEAAPVISFNNPMFYRKGSVGRFLPGIEWRSEAVEGIEAGGNLWIKGPNIMCGYLLAGRGFVAVDAWYDCGDVVTVDQDGFIEIKARLKRFAKISGEMISLDAVEKMAEDCFGMGQNAVVSVADSKKGERLILYTLNTTASRTAFKAHLQQQGQSLLQLPSLVVVLETLPLLGSGKIDYVSLRAQAESGKKTEAALQ